MIDVLIIGAGPAGSFAGLLLARAGLAVTIVEQHAFPRDKVCGECLSATGLAVLGRANVALGDRQDEGDPRSASCPKIERARVHAGRSDDALVVPLDAPMLGISRALLDQTLLDAARSAGVIVLQPARVESVTPAAGDVRASVVVRDITTNQRQTIAARVIVVADGKAATGLRRPAPTDDLGIKTHYVNVAADPNAVTLFGFSGCYGGVAPIEGGRWNVALSVPAELVKRHGDLEKTFAALLGSNPAAARAFAGAERVAPWLATPLPRFSPGAVDWPLNVIPVGNAAAALEPIGGEGMGLALRSAELAATAIAAGLTSGHAIDVAALKREYAALWRTRSMACRSAARLLSSKGAGVGVEFLSFAPGVVRALAGLMGKSAV